MDTVQDGRDSPISTQKADDDSDVSETPSQERQQIDRLVSRMFGRERKANSEEEKTRHVGVVWKNLTVRGVGLGSVIQTTNLDILLGLPRLVKRLLTRRTILDDFTVC